ncbi:hypothetical protein AAY473_012415 [Plecturocebus cupreus]
MPAPSCSPTYLRAPGSSFRELGVHGGAGARLTGFAGLAWSERSEAANLGSQIGGWRPVGVGVGGAVAQELVVGALRRSHHLKEVPWLWEPGTKAEQNLRPWAPWTPSTPLPGTKSGTRNRGRSTWRQSGAMLRRWSCLAHRSGDLDTRDKPHR